VLVGGDAGRLPAPRLRFALGAACEPFRAPNKTFPSARIRASRAAVSSAFVSAEPGGEVAFTAATSSPTAASSPSASVAWTFC